MGNRKVLRGYIRVDKRGRPIVGSTILRATRPTGMNYVPIENPATYLCCSPWPEPPAIGKNVYLRYDGTGRLIPGSVSINNRHKAPSGKFKPLALPVPNKTCCTYKNTCTSYMLTSSDELGVEVRFVPCGSDTFNIINFSTPWPYFVCVNDSYGAPHKISGNGTITEMESCTTFSFLASYSAVDCATACAGVRNVQVYCQTNPVEFGSRFYYDAEMTSLVAAGYYSDGTTCYNITTGGAYIGASSCTP